jgi:hypothetical protein
MIVDILARIPMTRENWLNMQHTCRASVRQIASPRKDAG